MEIYIKDRKLKASLEDPSTCRKKYGKEMSGKILRRIQALAAAESLADFWPPLSGPERCHCLKGQLDGVISVDVKHPYRLLIRPVGVSEKESSDEKRRWESIKNIEILGIEDTHA